MRYDHQEKSSGWVQQKLAEHTLIVAGSGPLAYFCGLIATAMGVGQIVLVGEESLSSDRDCLPGQEKNRNHVEEWSRFFSRVNSRVRIHSEARLLDPQLLSRYPGLDGLIIADRKLMNIDLPTAEDVPTRSALVTAWGGILGTRLDPVLLDHLKSFPEAPLTSKIVAALSVEDLRKNWLLLPGEELPAPKEVFILPRSRKVTGSQTRIPNGLPVEPRINLVGAGTLGTWFALALGVQGQTAHLHIFDHGTIEENDLSSQILFYGAVGQPKAEVLAWRLSALFPHLCVEGHVMPVREDTLNRLHPRDALVACLDDLTCLALLNRTAIAQKQTLINGRAKPFGGDAICYFPGRTPCLDCSLYIEALSRNTDPAIFCNGTHPSTVTSNAIIGGIMAWLVLKALAGQPLEGIVEYNSAMPQRRIGLRSFRPICTCHESRCAVILTEKP
jgi:molybdopterin/thiamine biosynthesis adenylyltransferase